MDKYKPILAFIEKDACSIHCHWSDYVVNQLKAPATLEIILEIVEQSNKVPSEAVFILLSAIKYLHNDYDALSNLERNDTFQKYVSENYQEILEIATTRKVQANIPERAFPIADILSHFYTTTKFNIIELGASFGLLGQCLLNLNTVINKRNSFLQFDQQLPATPVEIAGYLGIEIDPPNKEWLLASFPDSGYAKRIDNFIGMFHSDPYFKLIKSSAFGFSKLWETHELIINNLKTIVLTSFMLYQLDENQQIELKNEIKEFTNLYNGHWVNQDVDLSKGIDKLEYFIEWDGEKVVELDDDMCKNWNWLV